MKDMAELLSSYCWRLTPVVTLRIGKESSYHLGTATDCSDETVTFKFLLISTKRSTITWFVLHRKSPGNSIYIYYTIHL